ncbi:hypothetical protein F5X68DRAFT_211803 [Plectosphaerella plurivora]|uniref:Uncharacterized protein n=1 Tax=Plectosphaerella plurivora TaxID=936078 RepID=A0A9P8V552_9PEZI|nr:hypothetical protein F5X68DRAFT_211803 [Plectosphaerella plurivora]
MPRGPRMDSNCSRQSLVASLTRWRRTPMVSSFNAWSPPRDRRTASTSLSLGLRSNRSLGVKLTAAASAFWPVRFWGGRSQRGWKISLGVSLFSSVLCSGSIISRSTPVIQSVAPPRQVPPGLPSVLCRVVLPDHVRGEVSSPISLSSRR